MQNPDYFNHLVDAETKKDNMPAIQGFFVTLAYMIDRSSKVYAMRNRIKTSQ